MFDFDLAGNKFAVIGDTHLSCKCPVNRIDDYPVAILNKLEHIRKILVSKDIKVCIILGDVFNTVRQNLSYINKCIEVFSSFGKSGISLYSIVGNHDILNERMDSLERTPLQTMFAADVIRHLDHLSFQKFDITGVDYPDIIPPANTEDREKRHYCIAHRYYNFELSDLSLHAEDLDALGYDCYVFGHDHEPYPCEKGNGWCLYRIGSLSRGTANKSNRERKPVFGIINGETGDIELIEIPCENGASVFAEKTFVEHKKEAKSVFCEVIDTIDKLGKGEDDDIFQYVQKLDVNKEVRELIEIYLKCGGFARTDTKQIG